MSGDFGKRSWMVKEQIYSNIWEELSLIKAEINMKLPSLNDYVRICRENRYKASKMKKDIEHDIGYFISRLPRFKNPVTIHFHWIESNRRRDLDNIAFAKKFILDAMVKSGKLKDDNKRFVTGFSDTFEYGKHTKVILYIDEVDGGTR